MVGSWRPPGRGWVYDPAGALRQSREQVPMNILWEVQRRAQRLIDSTLKPRYIKACSQERGIQLPGGYLLKMAGPLLLLLFELLFAGASCAFGLVRIEVCQT
jgi:hypothetical protein